MKDEKKAVLYHAALMTWNRPVRITQHAVLQSWMSDSSETGKKGGESAIGRDGAHTSRKSRSSRLSRTIPPFRDGYE